MKQYVQIRPPALFLVSSQSQGRWAETSTDPKIRGQIAGLSAFTERQAKAIENGVPSARVVRLPGANHYVFLSNEADVLRDARVSWPPALACPTVPRAVAARATRGERSEGSSSGMNAMSFRTKSSE